MGQAWLPQQQIIVVKSLIKGFFIFLSIQVKITVKLSRTKETKEIHLETGSTVNDLLREMNFKPDTLIVMSNNTPIPIDNELKEGQEVTIIQVSSGG